MPAVLRLSNVDRRPPIRCGAEAFALLNRIRFLAATCRASARLDLFDACSDPGAVADQGEEAQIVTLIRVMGQALGTRPVFRRPGEPDLGFDEAWLVATIGARMSDDASSFAFLLGRRVAGPYRRAFAILVTALADHLADTPRYGHAEEKPRRTPTRTDLSF